MLMRIRIDAARRPIRRSAKFTIRKVSGKEPYCDARWITAISSPKRTRIKIRKMMRILLNALIIWWRLKFKSVPENCKLECATFCDEGRVTSDGSPHGVCLGTRHSILDESEIGTHSLADFHAYTERTFFVVEPA